MAEMRKRTSMSVPEMGRLLGLGKTESYWLIKKNYFKTILVGNTMRVMIDSFEEWYANQFKYQKVDGTPPGEELKKTTYSMEELGQRLGLKEATAYELVAKGHFDVVDVLGKRRVTKESFERWYASQTDYRTVEDQELDADIMASTYGLPEMARMLGVHRQTIYYIVANEDFELIKVGRYKRATKESFEKWYANQVKHKKVNGEDPGAELTKKSYSFRDAANLLGIHSSNLYEIWREEKLETFTVDFTKRIPIEVFEEWYEHQIMYQKVGRMPTITDLQADFIPLHEAAALIGITKEKMSVITRASRFKDCFEIQVFEDKKWISKKSFQHFLNAQSVYQVVKETGPVKQDNQESMETKEYISRSEAAALAGVTSGTITKWMQMERFSCVGAGKVLRINRKEFLQWLKEYQEGAG